MELKKRVSELLREIGVPAHLMGYRHLREAIMIAVDDPEAVHSMMKTLYPKVAARFAVTPGQTERAMRHAIEVAWRQGDPEILQDYFGNTVHPDRGKPTNSGFIAAIADLLSMEGWRMYHVEWDDHEGNRHEMAFDSLEDARLEAEALKAKFNYVGITEG